MGTVDETNYPRVVSPLTKGPITQFVLEGKQALKSPEPENIRSMYNANRREGDETSDFSINPDPVPFQPSNFIPERFSRLENPLLDHLSSTMMRKVPVSRRHFDSFGSVDFSGLGKRGVMLHTDRYNWDLSKALDGLSQRERLQAELEYMERLRGIKRRREVLPHRAQLDLLMGGKKIEFTERFDIQREIQKLRSLILPQHAKDLFHGRGFILPEDHNSVKPRRFLPHDIDLEEDRNGAPIILSKEKRTVESIKARLRIPISAPQPAHMTRSKTNVTTGHYKSYSSGPGRSVTAMPSKKETSIRPAATAPTFKPASREIKIPISAREPDSEAEMIPESTPGVPKTTPAIGEIRPDVSEVTIQPEDASGRPTVSQQSTGRSAKAPTPNPLKGVAVTTNLSEDEQQRLKQTFTKLDTDGDGHIMFSQLKTQLPKQFSQSQERYIKQVYEITSSNTFFGVDEFMTMSYLTNVVTSLTGKALEAYSKVDLHAINEPILQYVELWQSVDRSNQGKINLDSLQDILSTASSLDLKSDSDKWIAIQDSLSLHDADHVSKIEFLAYIPLFEMITKQK